MFDSLVISYPGHSQNNATLFPYTTHLLNNLLYCSVSIRCAFPPTSRSLLTLSFLECPLFHLFNPALSFKCHTPSPHHHFHPQWSFSLGLDYFFKTSVNTLLCVYVCVPDGTENENQGCYFCVSLIVPGTGVSTQTVFSLRMGGWMDEKEWHSFDKVFWEY